MGAIGQVPVSGQRPRQRRAIETRSRLFKAALHEYESVGIETARIDDIVAAAGVSWGTFYRYFPRKEDVLIEAGAELARVFADFVRLGLEGGHPVYDVAVGGISRAATGAFPYGPRLRSMILREIDTHPEQLAAHLAERGVPSMAETMTVLLEEGQRRGEVRDDYPARAIAQITISAVFGAYRHEVEYGRPPGEWRGPAQNHATLAIQLLAMGFVPRADESPAGGPLRSAEAVRPMTVSRRGRRDRPAQD